MKFSTKSNLPRKKYFPFHNGFQQLADRINALVSSAAMQLAAPLSIFFHCACDKLKIIFGSQQHPSPTLPTMESLIPLLPRKAVTGSALECPDFSSFAILPTCDNPRSSVYAQFQLLSYVICVPRPEPEPLPLYIFGPITTDQPFNVEYSWAPMLPTNCGRSIVQVYASIPI